MAKPKSLVASASILAAVFAGMVQASAAPESPESFGKHEADRVAASVDLPQGAEQGRGCFNRSCDNEGPKAMDCRRGSKVIARAGGHLVYLKRSRACHAVWVKERFAPNFWPTEMHLEMQRRRNGRWRTVRRLVSIHEVCDCPDWGNMLGYRNHRFRFRAIHVDPSDPNPQSDAYTPWFRPRRR